MTFAEYAALDGISWHALQHMRKSPLHFDYARRNPLPDSDTFRLGRASHTAILEPERFLADYVLWTGGRRAGKKWKAFKEEAGSRTILTKDQHALALAMQRAVRSHDEAMSYLAAGFAEQPLSWIDPATRLHCKGRPDWLSRSRPAIVELKTAKSVDERLFGNQAARLGYHCQLAHYVNGYKVGSKQPPLPAVLIAVENTPPHDVAVFVVDPEEALYAGQEEVAELLEKVAECASVDCWPGRFARARTLTLPQWIFDEDPDGFADGLNLEGLSNG